MKRSIATSAFAAALLTASFAAAAAETTYTVEPTHTFARAEYLHMGLATAQIRFDKTTGTITLDTDKKTGRADITIDVNSVDSGVDKFDQHLLGTDLFDAAKYPTITFKSNQFKFEGDQLKSLTGDLTVHGVTKPVTLEVTRYACKLHPFMKKPACGADAVATIKRSEFGVGYAVPMVSDDVKLIIQIEALAEAQ